MGQDRDMGASCGPGCEASPSAGQGAVFAKSHPSRVATFQYRFSQRPREDGTVSERHDWCLIGEAGAINIWAEPIPMADGFGERWFGGIECHWSSPPDYYEGRDPHHERCWLLGKPCWHDGSSLSFSEGIERHLPSPAGKQLDGSINDFMLYHLRDWFDDKLAPRDSDGSGEAGETGTGSTEGDSAGPKGIAK